jgi:uncharacterized membrane protein
MNPWELHPMLVHFPIAFLLSATLLDMVAVLKQRGDLAWVANGMLIAGEVSAAVAAVAGVLAFFTLPAQSDAAQTRMIVHWIVAVAAVLLFAIVAIRRWKTRRVPLGRAGLAMSLVASALLLVAGGLGGYLVFQDGVGVAVQPTQEPSERLAERD